jgi:PRC-barrel domain
MRLQLGCLFGLLNLLLLSEAQVQIASAQITERRTEPSIARNEQGKLIPVRDLVGARVRTPDGQTVGNVVDILYDNNGRASAFIITLGGFLGIGEKSVAFPFEQARVVTEDDRNVIVITVNRDQLRAAPEFKFQRTGIPENLPTAAPFEVTIHDPGTIAHIIRDPTNALLCLGSRCELKAEADPRVVDVLFATNRKEAIAVANRASFTGDRADQLAFGAARIRIPEDHRLAALSYQCARYSDLSCIRSSRTRSSISSLGR